MKPCIQIGQDDNVANVLMDACQDDTLSVSGADKQSVTAIEDIRRFHKIALFDIAKGSDIVRDGYVIGRAKTAIKRGEWVHVHNLESKRA